MLFSLVWLLLIGAVVITLAHAIGKAPLWPAVLLVVIVECLSVGLPVR